MNEYWILVGQTWNGRTWHVSAGNNWSVCGRGLLEHHKFGIPTCKRCLKKLDNTKAAQLIKMGGQKDE